MMGDLLRAAGSASATGDATNSVSSSAASGINSRMGASRSPYGNTVEERHVFAFRRRAMGWAASGARVAAGT
ncbi:MAG: hypothetical protein AMXMBFR42_28020 [Burkholderiales bacterium]